MAQWLTNPTRNQEMAKRQTKKIFFNKNIKNLLAPPPKGKNADSIYMYVVGEEGKMGSQIIYPFKKSTSAKYKFHPGLMDFFFPPAF